MFRRFQYPTLLTASWLVAAVLIPALAPGAAFATGERTIVTRLSTAVGEPVSATHYLSATKIRTAQDELEVIVDLESGVLTHVDHRQRQYYETTSARLADHFIDIEGLARTHLILKRLLSGVAEVEAKAEDRERQIAGATCREHTVAPSAEFEVEVCNALAWPVADAFYEARKLRWANIGPMSVFFAKSFDAMKELEGFPLMMNVTSSVPGLEMMTRQRVTVNEAGIPADAFQVPAGYEKIDSPYD